MNMYEEEVLSSENVNMTCISKTVKNVTDVHVHELSNVINASFIKSNVGDKSVKQSQKSRGINLVHLNVHFLASKITNGEIKAELDNIGFHCHILGFSETFLTDAMISNDQIHLPGYVLHRKDRTGKLGGGLAVYVTDRLLAVRREDLEAENVETIWLEIKPKGSKPFLLCNL